MKKLFMLLIMLTLLISLSGHIYAENEKSADVNQYYGFAYDTRTGEEIGDISIKTIENSNNTIITFKYKGNNTKTIVNKKAENIWGEDDFVDNPLGFKELTINKSGLFGYFVEIEEDSSMTESEIVGIYAEKTKSNTKQVIKEKIKPMLNDNEGSKDISLLSCPEGCHDGGSGYTTKGKRLKGTGDNRDARIQASALETIRPGHATSVYLRLQAKNVGHSITYYEHVTSSYIENRVISNYLQFRSAAHYPVESTKYISGSFAYNHVAVNLNIPVSSVNFTQGSTRVRWDMNRTFGWNGDEVNYNGDTNTVRDEEGWLTSIVVESSPNARGDLMMRMDGGYTKRRSHFDGFTTYSSHDVTGYYYLYFE